ncbi:Type IV fimbrial biogenesis protein PilW [Vibrio chagasii]|uniref:PilW family protein n=1 Tax=Vibrio chagasii TaxID=170679 RepID=UPI001EFD9AA9|nr:pilus assembly protein PilW [Vibrio chagasii]MCG9563637.1 pilus assembly protein PilW [Vibrio chagasii]CAH6798100.1 Type IV fimbrial biogenesis protein PilW [Vibrio chagasii]CAH6820494.1 Type IV fimbrial biogenesis protein PilW [Vibrio chagasii]CAH6922061.1 Type IV fimbrial biogenesis protein PilW [Vibrio chagasii]CAH6930214.1 Type IV fimbrial biogenesis protein PilW [Vibrio chagasii]
MGATALVIMVMRSATKLAQGSTLVEVMVASAIGVIVIGTIGSVFITNQRLSSEKSLEVLLSQNLFSTAQMMKEEILRAGYNANAGQSVKLSGAPNTIYAQKISADEAYLGFVYLQNSTSSAYRNIVYQFKDNKLNYCLGESTDLLAIDEKPFSNVSGDVTMTCQSLFFERQIQIDAFSVSVEDISSSQASSQRINMTLEASLVNADLSQKVMTSVVQRNWQ